MIVLLTVESCAQTRIHNAIMLIDTSDNASYNQVHWLIRTPYLSIKASNEAMFQKKFYGRNFDCLVSKILFHKVQLPFFKRSRPVPVSKLTPAKTRTLELRQFVSLGIVLGF